MTKILIIEDDPAILLGLLASLEEENYEILSEEDGQKGFDSAKKSNPDLLLLDLMLPNKNGLDICRELRREGYEFPILMLTSKKDEIDKVLGFETGADDYVTKPFGIMELKMRIKALLKRTGTPKQEPATYEFGDITVEYKKLEAFIDGEPIGLSAKEFQILKYFIEKEGEVVSRDTLLNDIWGYDSYPTTRTVDNYMLSIRKKIEDDPSNPKHILTIHTVGYKFVR